MKICLRCSELFPDDASFCPADGTALNRSVDRFLGRTIAARFRLIRRLGHGGMSIVYLARHELIARLSAIKILRPELSSIPEHRERFLREARAVNRINHPNIVEITDVGESDGVAYLVMEYVEGESLFSYIQRDVLPWDRAARIGMQVASALARAHQMGVIHRDLKPENILLVAKGDELVVKLTDFGIAKVASEPTLTLNEQLFGTPGYIAPEYISGLGVDARSDIYSLAVVIYEMATGVLPFEGHGQSELLLKPLTSAPTPPSRHVEGLPPDFEHLLLRCLAREPDERPHDAFAVHDALADVVRRYGSPSAPPRACRPSEAPPLKGDGERRGSETIIDSVSVSPTSVGQVATQEIASRWSTALVSLESLIARARSRGGEHASAATRAANVALVASEMLPRVDRASKVVGEFQARADRLAVSGREFRTNLGHAVDVLVHDRSRERAHLDAIHSRRQALARSLADASSGSPSGVLVRRTALMLPMPSGVDPRMWEVGALEQEESRVAAVIEDLGFQVDALQKQLDAKNEEFERELLEATASLEGALSALRMLTSELVRTIDAGVALVRPAP